MIKKYIMAIALINLMITVIYSESKELFVNKIIEFNNSKIEKNKDNSIEMDNKTLSDLFPYINGIPTNLSQEIDLNGDGYLERISLSDLGYSGGDGGYGLHVVRLENKEEIELSLPNTYTEEFGFPFYTEWNGKQMKIFAEDRCIKEIPLSILEEEYERKGMKNILENAKGKPDKILGDAISDFTIIYPKQEKNPVVVLKTYLTGLGSHVDCIGYGITELRLKEDNTWDVKHYFLFEN